MDIQALKLELVKEVLQTESKDILDQMLSFVKKADADFWSDLSDTQKQEVEIGLEQIEKGETEDWDEFVKRVS